MSLIILVTLIVLVHLMRARILFTRTLPKSHEPLDGQLYAVGKSVVAYQQARENDYKTIVCMHGWLEDYRYFTKIYGPADGEVILINSCDYHVPNKDIDPQIAPWQADISYQEGSIEYDAAVLIMAVQNLATGKELLLHGHSRGGAVLLEAIKQNPQLFKDAQVILEAPILPEAPVSRTHGLPPLLDKLVSKLVLYPFPFIAAWLARQGLPAFALNNMGPMTPRKKDLMTGLFFSPTTPQVLLNNIASMLTWPLENSVALFDNINCGYILIGSADSVLSRGLMLKSAHKNKGNLQVIQTKNSSHFISLDIPEQVKALNFK